jgi:hypothetical protein
MALYKILISTTKRIHTFSGTITDTVKNVVMGTVAGEIKDKIEGTISGYIYGVNYVATNLQQYSGVASGLISGIIEGTISGEISGIIVQDFENTISGIIQDKMCIPGLSFLQKDNEEIDWSTNSVDALKEKLLNLYREYPQNAFLPVHILTEELNLTVDGCSK